MIHKEFDELILSGEEVIFDEKMLSAREVTSLALRNAKLQPSENKYIAVLSFFNDYFKALSEEEQERRVRYYIERGFTYLIEMGIIADAIKVKEEYMELSENETIKSLLQIQGYDRARKEVCESSGEFFSNVIMFKMPLNYINRFNLGMFTKNNVSEFSRQNDFKFSLYNNGLGYGLGSIIQSEIKIDKEWLKECDNYIQGLSIKDFFTLKGYTFHGDSIVNSYIIATLSKGELSDENIKYIEDVKEFMTNFNYFPLFFQVRECCKNLDVEDDEIKVILGDDITDSYKAVLQCISKKKFNKDFYNGVVKMYFEDLKNIVNNAPAIKTDTDVFRGSKTRYYSRNLGSSFNTVTFTSTSLYSRVGTSNMFSSLEFTSCCMSKYKLKRGTRCLLLETLGMKGEGEVLLPPNTEFKVIDHKILSYAKTDEAWGDEPEEVDRYILCEQPLKKVDFTEFVSMD